MNLATTNLFSQTGNLVNGLIALYVVVSLLQLLIMNT